MKLLPIGSVLRYSFGLGSFAPNRLHFTVFLLSEMAAKEKKAYIVTEPADKIKFTGDLSKEVRVQLKISNKSDMKQAYKVKCTANDMFRIRPSTGILDYGQTATISLTFRSNGETPADERHHFGVYHIPAPEGCSADGAWSEHYGPPQGENKIKANWNYTIMRT